IDALDVGIHPAAITTVTGRWDGSHLVLADAAADSSPHTYGLVANASGDSVSVIDLTTHTPVDTDPTTPGVVDPTAVGDEPTDVPASADGRQLFVTTADGPTSVVDLTTGVVDAKPFGDTEFEQVLFGSDGQTFATSSVADTAPSYSVSGGCQPGKCITKG